MSGPPPRQRTLRGSISYPGGPVHPFYELVLGPVPDGYRWEIESIFVDSQTRVGDLKLDPDRHGVRASEQLVELTRTEYQLLELLMLNPRRVLPHSLIYERVWGYDFGPSSNALRVYIGYLRRKLAELNAPDVIHNVRGVGYVLREP